MRIKPIRDSLPGESILAVHPEPAPQLDADWRLRINYFTGRSLTSNGLMIEQLARSGHLATLGQAVTYGVRSGLRVGVDANDDTQLSISSGSGTTPEGEDLFIPENRTISWRQLDVFFTEDAAPTLSQSITLQRLAVRQAMVDGVPQAFGDWLEDQDVPSVGVLVLKPVSYTTLGNADPEDQCERDPANAPFEDRQWIDGCRIAIHVWPETWVEPMVPAETWRNRSAYGVFQADAQRRPGDVMPWEPSSVPIALIGFAAHNTMQFLDRHAVVRSEGNPKPRATIFPPSGSPSLWKARQAQFSEQVADQIGQGTELSVISDSLQWLPPSGAAPLETVRFNSTANGSNQRVTLNDDFFPRFSSQLAHRIAPIPEEELDSVLLASHSQDPFERNSLDEITVFVAVPQRHFNPRLLAVERLAPVFASAIADHTTRRNEWWQRRSQTRFEASEIVRSITGTGISYPEPDPGALGPEEIRLSVLSPPEPTFGMSLNLERDSAGRTIQGNARLTYRRENHSAIVEVLIVGVEEGDNLEPEVSFRSGENLEAALAFDPNVDAGELRIRAGISLPGANADETQTALRRLLANGVRIVVRDGQSWRLTGRIELTPLDTLEVTLALNAAVASEVGRLEQLGVDLFIRSLQEKISAADDAVDIGFSSANAALYRIRQLMLGSSDASRLATSPALAAIAVTGESAVTTRENIRQFVDDLQFRSTRTDAQEPSANAGPFRRSTVPLTDVTFSSPEFTVGEQRIGIGVPDLDVAGPAVQPGLGVQRDTAVSLELIAPSVVTEESIFAQTYIVGKAELPRTITIGERIRRPLANESKDAAVSTFHGIVTSVIALEMNVKDLQVSGIAVLDDSGNARFENGRVQRTSLPVAEITPAILRRILQDPDPPDPDEAAFFSAAVDILEHAIALLRRVEGRAQQYRAAVTTCQRTLDELQGLAVDVDARLKEISDELAEARHDLSVATALRDEEEARIGLINLQRDQIVAQHVKYVAYHRPRISNLIDSVPTGTLNSELFDEPLPACLVSDVNVPVQLRAMIDLFRDAPIRWFPRMAALLEQLNHRQILYRAVSVAQQRATTYVATTRQAPFAAGTTTFSRTMANVYSAQESSIRRYRAQSAQTNVAAVTTLTWRGTRNEAEEIVSVGDLLDADHTRSQVSQQAARQLDEIAQVAGCLYRVAGELPAAIRLVWAERISQFDEPVDLTDLSRLPRWGDDTISYRQRVELQELNRWLFTRIVTQDADAVGLINDLVRVCILLASHAPVKQILSGRVTESVPVTPGGIVSVRPATPNIVIGMPVAIYKANRVVARAIVDDLSSNQATAKVLQVYESNVTTSPDDIVQFSTSIAINSSIQQFGLFE